MSVLSTQPSCPVISQWEEASALLAPALTKYLEACLALETKYPCASPVSKQLVERIDSKLEALHSVMDRQLSRSRLTLAKTRNRLAFPLLKLPEEILSKIFINVLCLHDMSEPARLKLEDRLPQLYRNLHNLSGVCVAWRKVVIHHAALWSVIPIYTPAEKYSAHRATTLSLQRATRGPLHLAATVSVLPQQLPNELQNYLPRFHSINIESVTQSSLKRLLQIVLEKTNRPSLRELSISYWPGRPDTTSTCFLYEYFSPREVGLFRQLVNNLSALRVQNVDLEWTKIIVSTSLVKLRLQAITFGDKISARNCLRALSAAILLRDLQIISVVICREDFELDADLIRVNNQPIKFPRLKSLLLDGLAYNAIEVFSTLIAPGSHHLTLSLSPISRFVAYRDPEEGIEYEEMDSPNYGTLLENIPVHTLLLSPETTAFEGLWMPINEVGNLLGFLPSLKALKLTGRAFRQGDCAALTKPKHGQFPKLETLSLSCVDIYDVEGIKEVVASHSVRQMELGGRLLEENKGETGAGRDIRFNGEIVDWFKSNVPEFHLLDPDHEPAEFHEWKWQLW